MTKAGYQMEISIKKVKNQFKKLSSLNLTVA